MICYCPLTNNDFPIFVMFYIKLSWNFVFSHISNMFFEEFLNIKLSQQSKILINFEFFQQQQLQTPHYYFPNPENTEL